MTGQQGCNIFQQCRKGQRGSSTNPSFGWWGGKYHCLWILPLSGILPSKHPVLNFSITTIKQSATFKYVALQSTYASKTAHFIGRLKLLPDFITRKLLHLMLLISINLDPVASCCWDFSQINWGGGGERGYRLLNELQDSKDCIGTSEFESIWIEYDDKTRNKISILLVTHFKQAVRHHCGLFRKQLLNKEK